MFQLEIGFYFLKQNDLLSYVIEKICTVTATTNIQPVRYKVFDGYIVMFKTMNGMFQFFQIKNFLYSLLFLSELKDTIICQSVPRNLLQMTYISY